MSSNEGKKKQRKPPPSRLPEDRLKYFQQIEELLNGEELQEDLDARKVLVNNAMKETKGAELDISMDPECSRILQLLLTYLNDVHVRLFFHRLGEGITQLLVHKNGSHVLQTLIMKVPEVMSREIVNGEVVAGTTYENEPLPLMKELFLQMCETFEDFWPDAMFDAYGSHIVRTTLNVLAGMKEETLTKSKTTKRYQGESESRAHIEWEAFNAEKKPVPPEFDEMLGKITDIITRSISPGNAHEFLTSTLPSAVLQLLMVILKPNHPEQLSKLISTLLNLAPLSSSNASEKTKAVEFIKSMIENNIGSHFFEVLLMVCPIPMLKSLNKHLFRGNLVGFVEHPIANYAITKLVLFTPEEKMLANLIHELLEKTDKIFPRISSPARASLLEAFIEASLRLDSENCQERIFKALKNAFKIEESNEEYDHCLELILYLHPIENIKMEKAENIKIMKPNIHGSKIIQGLCKYTNPEVLELLSDSLIKLDLDVVLRWSKDGIGSRVLETLLGSKMPLEKKLTFVDRLKGQYVELAKDKFGGRVVEACWKNIDIKKKELITAELAEAHKELKENFFSRFVVRTCRVEDYIHKRNAWKQTEQGNLKKLEMFRDILEAPVAPVGTGGKKRKHSETEEDSKDSKKSSKKATPAPAAPPVVPLPTVTDDPEISFIFDALKETAASAASKKVKKEKKNTKK